MIWCPLESEVVGSFESGFIQHRAAKLLRQRFSE